MFFWEQADSDTGIVRDRAGVDGGPSANESAREIGSIASVGFGLSGMCVAAARGWEPRAQVIERTRRTLRFFAERSAHEHGWFYHFINLRSGAREWSSELSSIDTALLLGGVLTVRQCFSGDPEVARLADAIYRRVDFQWMLAGDPLVLSHGWKPEEGFLQGAMGSLLRADDPLHPGDRIADPSDPGRGVVRLEPPGDDVRGLSLCERRRSALRAPVLARVGGLSRVGARSRRRE